MGRLDQLGDAVRQTIRAYHGSPYDFDKFDASKIGTGEGNQSFGYGHYFAQNEDVGKFYRDTVGPDVELPVPEDLSQKLKRAWDTYEDISRRHSDWSVNNSAGEYRRNPLDSPRDDAIAAWQAVRSEIDAVTTPPAGKVYEVEIAHPESSLLSLDSMPDEQSPVIADALKRLGFVVGENLPPRHRVSGFSVMRRLGDGRSPAEVAKVLLGEGVPGVKYFDQESRATGDGTRNYVMFPGTEDSIRILRKYGMMAPIAAGAASSYNDDP